VSGDRSADDGRADRGLKLRCDPCDVGRLTKRLQPSVDEVMASLREQRWLHLFRVERLLYEKTGRMLSVKRDLYVTAADWLPGCLPPGVRTQDDPNDARDLAPTSRLRQRSRRR
jgi:hypothetical protein